MRHIFLNLGLGAQVDFVDLVEIAIENRAGGDPPAGGVTQITARLRRRKIPEHQEVTEALAAEEPVLVETGDRDGIRHVHLVDEDTHLVDDRLHQ